MVSPGAIWLLVLTLEADDQLLVQLAPLNWAAKAPLRKRLYLRGCNGRGGRVGRRAAERRLKRLKRSRSWRPTASIKIVGHRRDAGVYAAEDVLAVRRRVGRGDQRLKRVDAESLQRRGRSGFRDVHVVKLDTAFCASVRIELRASCGRQIRRDEAVAAGQRLQEIVLVLERQFIAGLVAQLQTEVGVLAGRDSISGLASDDCVCRTEGSSEVPK